MYHRFGESDYPSTNITLEQFQSHLEEFKTQDYNVLPLEFIVDSILTESALPNNTIAISISIFILTIGVVASGFQDSVFFHL